MEARATSELDLLNDILKGLNEYAKKNPDNVKFNKKGRLDDILRIANYIYQYSYNKTKSKMDLGKIEEGLFSLLTETEMQKHVKQQTAEKFKTMIAGITAALNNIKTSMGHSTLKEKIIEPSLKKLVDFDRRHQPTLRPQTIKTSIGRSTLQEKIIQPSLKKLVDLDLRRQPTSRPQTFFEIEMQDIKPPKEGGKCVVVFYFKPNFKTLMKDPIDFLNTKFDLLKSLYSVGQIYPSLSYAALWGPFPQSSKTKKSRLHSQSPKSNFVFVMELNISEKEAEDLMQKADQEELAKHITRIHYGAVDGFRDKELEKISVEYRNGEFEEKTTTKSMKKL